MVDYYQYNGSSTSSICGVKKNLRYHRIRKVKVVYVLEWLFVFLWFYHYAVIMFFLIKKYIIKEIVAMSLNAIESVLKKKNR